MTLRCDSRWFVESVKIGTHFWNEIRWRRYNRYPSPTKDVYLLFKILHEHFFRTLVWNRGVRFVAPLGSVGRAVEFGRVLDENDLYRTIKYIFIPPHSKGHTLCPVRQTEGTEMGRRTLETSLRPRGGDGCYGKLREGEDICRGEGRPN